MGDYAQGILETIYTRLKGQLGIDDGRATQESIDYMTWRDLAIGSASGVDVVRQLFNHLETCTLWLEAPASVNYHGSHDGGLVRHSVAVTVMLWELTRIWLPDTTEKTVGTVGLLHDVGKIDQYERVNDEWWSWRDEQQMVSMNHSLRSLRIISEFVCLSEGEWQAIAAHDGQYVEQNRSLAMKEEPLTLLLHWADVWVSRFVDHQSDED